MASRKKTDGKVHQILGALQRIYRPAHPKAKIEVYRYGPASIRIRIVDPDFSGRDRTARDDMVWEILETLPEETRAEISLLLLLTPLETKTSLTNMEFENPTPTRL